MEGNTFQFQINSPSRNSKFSKIVDEYKKLKIYDEIFYSSCQQGPPGMPGSPGLGGLKGEKGEPCDISSMGMGLGVSFSSTNKPCIDFFFTNS